MGRPFWVLAGQLPFASRAKITSTDISLGFLITSVTAGLPLFFLSITTSVSVETYKREERVYQSPVLENISVRSITIIGDL